MRPLLRDGVIDRGIHMAVFESLYRWLQHGLTQRGKHAYELPRCIRLPLLRPIFLAEQMYQQEVFKRDLQCTELIMLFRRSVDVVGREQQLDVCGTELEELLAVHHLHEVVPHVANGRLLQSRAAVSLGKGRDA